MNDDRKSGFGGFLLAKRQARHSLESLDLLVNGLHTWVIAQQQSTSRPGTLSYHKTAALFLICYVLFLHSWIEACARPTTLQTLHWTAISKKKSMLTGKSLHITRYISILKFACLGILRRNYAL
ncbi:hypothetical protein CC78DRAFT_31832 [Lojkania enalia]|uniref:Uncharacterized protein n=1 Tax=Lojkania enalia TaxID=147567 RepID=A0A9P4KFQ6_9PLEO|nr:hypothetical protein CC78DRAFT_31832 [Didymosphaeria enalia]